MHMICRVVVVSKREAHAHAAHNIVTYPYRWSYETVQVVTFSDMMEMLTNYEYTIDVTSDAGGALETFGPEAGYGIISAQQMCRWVADNCAETCPGE